MAFLYPGVAWTDPFLLKPGETLTQFPVQGMLDIGTLTIVAIGFALVKSSARASARHASATPARAD